MTDTRIPNISQKSKGADDVPGGKNSKEKGPSEAEIMTDVADWIDRVEMSAMMNRGREFPHRMIVVQPERTNEPMVVAIDDQNICYKSTVEELASEIVRELATFSGFPGFGRYFCDFRRAKTFAEFWRARSARAREFPQTVAFIDDPKPAFHRLGFKRPEYALDLASAPTWRGIVGRMGKNGPAFCAWVWSLLEPGADRKQSVYIFGEKDCGKSRVSEGIARMMGATKAGMGAYVPLTSEHMSGQWGNAALIGKRLATIDEADPCFFSGSKFKVITGSCLQLCEDKNQKAIAAKIDTKFLFTSNKRPKVQSRDEIFSRLIVLELLTHGLTKDQLMPDAQFDALLDAELPPFLAYCRECYRPFEAGKRIVCDYSILEEASEEHEQAQEDLFHDCFVKKADAFVAYKDMIRVMRAQDGYHRLNKNEAMAVIETWTHQFKLRPGREFSGKTRGPRGYHGLELKPMAGSHPGMMGTLSNW